jgi:capsular polysaccharide biosynthesis protein
MSEEKSPLGAISVNLIDFLLAQRRRLLIITIAALIGSTIVSYMLPVRYRSTTILLVSPSTNISRALLSEQQDPWDYLTFGDEKNCEHYSQILRSQEILNAMNQKYGLMKYYGIPENDPKKYSILKDYYMDNFSFEITEFESIKIDVYDKDPAKASEMANGLVQIADSLFREIEGQRTRAAFNIVKQQYDSTQHQINMLQDSMNFFRKQGITSYDYQIKEYTKGYADAEVKGSPQSVKDMEDKLKPFAEYGKQYWITAYNIGDAFRWFQLVKTSYIQAKANAEKYISPFFIAERAVPSDKKAYPIRWLVVVGSTIAVLFFSIVLLLFINRFSKRQ